MSNKTGTLNWWKPLLKKPLPKVESEFRKTEVKIPSPLYLDALDFSDIKEIREELDQKIVEFYSKPRELDEQEALFNDYRTSLFDEAKRKSHMQDIREKRRKKIEMTIRIPTATGLPAIGQVLWHFASSVFSTPASSVAIVLPFISIGGIELATFTAEKWLETEFNGFIHGISGATQALAENV
jgi:hypothetical protein